jgi:hypothetical protein
VTAFAKEFLRMRLLKGAKPDFGRRNMRGDGQYGHVVALAIEQPVDEVQIARSAASRTYGELPGHRRLGARGKGCRLFVARMDPLDLAEPPQAVR